MIDQVKLLAREVAKKYSSMAFSQVSLSIMKTSLSTIQENFDILHLENVYLAQKLDEASNTSLLVFYEYFEIILLQVEHFFLSFAYFKGASMAELDN